VLGSIGVATVATPVAPFAQSSRGTKTPLQLYIDYSPAGTVRSAAAAFAPTRRRNQSLFCGGSSREFGSIVAPLSRGQAFLVSGRMASASTEIGPFFATPHHAPIELPEQLLTMIMLVLRDSRHRPLPMQKRDRSAGLMGWIGSVSRSWRRLLKGVLMGDELAWLRVQGAAEAAECLSSFPHAKSLRIVGDAAAGEIVSALGSGSVARLAIATNSVVRNCACLDQLVGLRALKITECRNLESLGRMTQLTSLDLGSTLRESAASCAASGCLRTPAMR
jgi:hypothetical protein